MQTRGDEVSLEQARRIGFNNVATHGDRTFVVQTEVTGSKALVVRTTVLERGVARASESKPCPDLALGLNVVQAAVELQHKAVIAKLKSGLVE